MQLTEGLCLQMKDMDFGWRVLVVPDGITAMVLARAVKLGPPMSNDNDPLATARAQWRWRGKDRPPFADLPAPGQVSVWDFPRPPALVRELREIVVCWGGLEIARTRSAWAVPRSGL